MTRPNLQSPTSRREAAKTKSRGVFLYSKQAGESKKQIFAVIFMIMGKVHVVGL